MLNRAIIHIDGDSFFASVETALNHKLKGKPVVTGHERGIASAMSKEAKALGISRGQPIYQIKKLFPHVIIVESNYYNYGIFAERMYNIVGRYTDLVHEYSIDECFADITGLDKLYKCSYEEIGARIKRDLQNELGITFSLGLAPTKVLAKIASKWQKPDGFCVIHDDKIHDFLKGVSIGKIWGIGPNTSIKLRQLGLETAYDFIIRDRIWVEKALSKPYLNTWRELQGESVYEIGFGPEEEQKSIQSTRTFKPPSSRRDFLLSQLSKNIEGTCARARAQKVFAKRVYFFLKSQNFSYSRGEIILANPLNQPNEVMSVVEAKFNLIYNSDKEYRATGITLADLTPVSGISNDLFGAFRGLDAWRDVFRKVDQLDVRFGSQSVILGSSLRAFRKSREKLIISKKLRLPYMGEVK